VKEGGIWRRVTRQSQRLIGMRKRVKILHRSGNRNEVGGRENILEKTNDQNEVLGFVVE
jgi:hypothetical protein